MAKLVKNLWLWEQDEPFLHSHFYQMISPDFYTAYEVPGKCILNHPCLETTTIRTDFLCYPKPHLVESGFAETWFAVEIKADKGHYLEKGLRQAFWYTLTAFTVKDRTIVPSFSCLWAPEEMRDRGQEVSNLAAGRADRLEAKNDGIKHMMTYLNVGTIQLGDSLESNTVWRIDFHGRYASRSNALNFDGSKRGLSVSENIQSFKLRVGNKPGVVNHTGIMGVSA